MGRFFNFKQEGLGNSFTSSHSEQKIRGFFGFRSANMLVLTGVFIL